ncbi:uncharacterized protein F4822DRAFT_435556 [Hypoxylon trugodes]|uniref:uncharacterized protein n=1 Tax=Hypoxylon trugodes TaxID=326681 RepID=UPI00219BC8F4|nr:uncharacterized protein F4822DRAFT_435556 [Hypoxylon trugodes]KAI1393136.1 hypothetical protein F4822DRAFT_435556 [Hypoxylon trugodes]
MTSPNDPHAKVYSHVNGSEGDTLARLAVSELCKGWPVYRDSSEWKNFRSLFCDDAYVWTTWSGRQTIDGFIQMSKEGKAKGDFIMHRECGTLVELDPLRNRAVGKMKATITQRFRIGGDDTMGLEPIVFDVDCDCRFNFFCFRNSDTDAWKIKYVKLIYEKDKLVPVDGKTSPSFTKETLDRYPEGYKYLGAAQHMLGHDVDLSLPTIQGPEYGLANIVWLELYEKMEQWLDGARDVDLSITPGHKNTNGNGSSNGHYIEPRRLR